MPPSRSSFPPSRQSVLQPLRKKQKQQEPSRFVPCPVCHRSFPSYLIHDHVDLCLDSGQILSSKLDEHLAVDVIVEERLKSTPIDQDCTSSAIAHELSSSANEIFDGRDGGASEAQALPEDVVPADPGHKLQIFQVTEFDVKDLEKNYFMDLLM